MREPYIRIFFDIFFFIETEKKGNQWHNSPLVKINTGLHLVTLVSENIYDTMPVTNLSLHGKSLHQRFLVMYIRQSNWNWDVYKNGTQPQ